MIGKRILGLLLALALAAGGGIGWVAHDLIHPSQTHVVVDTGGWRSAACSNSFGCPP